MRYVVREKFFRLGEDNTITHEDGTPAYRVDGRALTLRNHMDIYDMQGSPVGAVQRKLVSMLPQFEITLQDGSMAVLHKQLSFLHQRWTLTAGSDAIDLDGNVLQHNYSFTRNGAQLASVSKAWVALTDTYGVDIADGENDVLILGAVLGLEADQDSEQHRNSFNLG
ncbi:MAG: LURP-one-related family protein [Candidatus Dormibacteraeota bacterium]|nr:LURP-one-related family protein [Candidatus Dormibacteraeota bacterium]